MSVAEREIVKQAPVHTGMKVAEDDRWLGRWVFNLGAPISLAEFSGSRFIGKFEDDVLPAKKPVFFAPHMARSTGLYEHRAVVGNDSGSAIDSMMSIPVNSQAHGTAAPLSQYDNNPKLCAYLLMRDYERRGLVLFEDLRGLSDDDFSFIFDLILPPEVRARWAKTTRTVLDHEFRGPFSDQYKAWFGPEFKAGLIVRSKAIFPGEIDRKLRDQISSMGRELRAGANRAWSWQNSVLNTTEQQIRRYRNGHRGKEFYDMPDERMSNPVPPLDLLCLADTNRQPIDLQQVEATNAASKATQDSMVVAMETLGEKIAGKMTQGVTAEQMEEVITRRLAAQRAEWEAEAQAKWDAQLATLKASEN